MSLVLDNFKHSRVLGAARLLTSDSDGERLAALAALERTVPGGAVALIERALAPSSVERKWRELASACCINPALFGHKELGFVTDMFFRNTAPTPRQMNWLRSLAARTGKGAL